MSVNKVKKGFTLSEVLITLVVIGIVAALAIPAVIYNVQKNTWVTRLKNANSQIVQAANLIMLDNGGSMVGAFTPDNSNAMMNAFGRKMSFVKTCLLGQGAGECWPLLTNIKDLHGDQFPYDLNIHNARAILADGSLLSFEAPDEDCADYDYQINGEYKACGVITIDVTGLKAPNIYGRDIFRFVLAVDGVHASGAIGTYWGDEPGAPVDFETRPWACNPSSDNGGYGGYNCTVRVLKENGMNY